MKRTMKMTEVNVLEKLVYVLFIVFQIGIWGMIWSHNISFEKGILIGAIGTIVWVIGTMKMFRSIEVEEDGE